MVASIATAATVLIRGWRMPVHTPLKHAPTPMRVPLPRGQQSVSYELGLDYRSSLSANCLDGVCVEVEFTASTPGKFLIEKWLRNLYTRWRPRVALCFGFTRGFREDSLSSIREGDADSSSSLRFQ